MARHADIQAIIARQDGSEVARERCAALMRVISGEITLEEAAAEIGISTQRLHELRERMTAMSVTSLEPQAAGRPPSAPPDPKEQRIAELEVELGRTRRDLDCALIRAELALTFGDRLGRKKNSNHDSGGGLSATRQRKTRGRPG